MADQADNRIDANTSSPRQTYSEGQLAITDAANARRVAEARAAEATVQANRQSSNAANVAFGNASGPKVLSNTVDSNDFGGNPITITPAAPAPKPRTSKRGR